MTRGLVVGCFLQLFSTGVLGISSFTPNAMIGLFPPGTFVYLDSLWLILGLNPTAALKGDRCQETLFYELFRKRSVRPTLSIIQFYSLSQFHRLQYEHTWVLTSELTQINKYSQLWWHTAIILVLGRPK